MLCSLLLCCLFLMLTCFGSQKHSHSVWNFQNLCKKHVSVSFQKLMCSKSIQNCHFKSCPLVITKLTVLSILLSVTVRGQLTCQCEVTIIKLTLLHPQTPSPRFCFVGSKLWAGLWKGSSYCRRCCEVRKNKNVDVVFLLELNREHGWMDGWPRIRSKIFEDCTRTMFTRHSLDIRVCTVTAKWGWRPFSCQTKTL